MKKTLFLTASLLILNSCTSTKVNLALDYIGAFNDEIKIVKLSNADTEVIFFPMIHIGTEPFYNDIIKKIDSLENLGFYTYCESMSSIPNDSTSLRKARKLLGFPIPKKGKGYMSVLDSLYKFKLKKKLISQPTYKDLGIDSLKGRNVDLTLNQVIDEYERRYGQIILNKCDYQTAYSEKTVCKDKPVSKKNRNEIILEYRNKNVINNIISDSHKKIIIMYGANHFIGIKKDLLSLGFVEM